MLIEIDEMAIAFAERISHRVQILTGKTNFFLARVASKLILIAPIFITVFKNENPDQVHFIANAIAGLFIGATWYFLFGIFIKGCDEKKALSQMYQGYKNPEKLRRQPLRTGVCMAAGMMWVCSTIDFDHVINMAACYTFCWISLVFQACDTLPPGKSKIREWIDGLKAWGSKPIPATSSAFRVTDETLFIFTDFI